MTRSGARLPLHAVISEPAEPILWRAGRILAWLLRVVTRQDWRHADRIPAEDGVVVAANHISNVDPLILSHYLVYAGRWPRFLAKDSLFDVPILGRLLAGCGQIPVRRGRKDASAALEQAVRAVQAGRCVVVYPEGTITADRNLWPMAGKTGAARIALAARCPVIPVAQWGAQQIMYGKQVGLPRLLPRKTMIVSAGMPVPLGDLEGQPVSAELLAEATRRIMSAIADQLVDLRGGPAPAEGSKAGTADSEEIWEFGHPNRPTAGEDPRGGRK